jgi:hypothetical protein
MNLRQTFLTSYTAFAVFGITLLRWFFCARITTELDFQPPLSGSYLVLAVFDGLVSGQPLVTSFLGFQFAASAWLTKQRKTQSTQMHLRCRIFDMYSRFAAVISAVQSFPGLSRSAYETQENITFRRASVSRFGWCCEKT